MLNREFINKLLKYDNVSYCSFCDYTTEHRPKYDRHLTTTKHKIAVAGLQCCGLSYYNKHQWINHKKSAKHRNGDSIRYNPTPKNAPKKTVNFVKKCTPEKNDKDVSVNEVLSSDVKKQIVFKKKEVVNDQNQKKEVVNDKNQKKEVVNDQNQKKQIVLKKKTIIQEVDSSNLIDIVVSHEKYDLSHPAILEEVVPVVVLKKSIWKK
jgi:hypothetical protein